MANHSATHLLRFALENVLGEVRQQGSMVRNSNFTFDFTCRKVRECRISWLTMAYSSIQYAHMLIRLKLYFDI